TYAIGIGLGRRFDVGRTALDFVFGPEVIAETQEMEGPDGGKDGRNNSDVRLDAQIRFSIPIEGRTRLFAALDGETPASRLASAPPSDGGYPPLPSWSGGLTLGAAWDLR